MAKKPTKSVKKDAGKKAPAKRPARQPAKKVPGGGSTPKGTVPREEIPVVRRGGHECKEMRLFIVIGGRRDKALQGAVKWALERAQTLGGTTHIWRSHSNGSPMRKFRAADISDGHTHTDRTPYRRNSDGSHNFGTLLPDFQNCQGRITELMIFHHGTPVDEAEVADELQAIFAALRVPVCRVAWWACNAAVALDVSPGGWTDVFMMQMGGRARCEPCGCAHPIELVWPTAGKCGINDPDDATVPTAAKTGDGKVNRLRWGYRQPDGSLSSRPDPSLDHYTRWPNDRDPPHGQPTPTVDASVMGVPVSQGTF